MLFCGILYMRVWWWKLVRVDVIEVMVMFGKISLEFDGVSVLNSEIVVFVE